MSVATILGAALKPILETVGKTVTDLHADTTSRQKVENESGEHVATGYMNASTAAGAQRVEIQKSQGTWGPFGLAGFVIAMAFAFHVCAIVGDSSPWHLTPTLKFYIVPWLDWTPHKVGSWGVATLPGKFEETEHAILQALFFVGPPSAAVAVLARAFRR